MFGNLCVRDEFRGKQIGTTLVRCTENIVKMTWKFDQLILAVDDDNAAAVSLYRKEGYRPIPKACANGISHYIKAL